MSSAVDTSLSVGDIIGLVIGTFSGIATLIRCIVARMKI